MIRNTYALGFLYILNLYTMEKLHMFFFIKLYEIDHYSWYNTVPATIPEPMKQLSFTSTKKLKMIFKKLIKRLCNLVETFSNHVRFPY